VILGLSGQDPKLAPDVFVASGAVVIGRVTVGAGSSIWFGSVLRGDVDRITIGKETNIQDLTMVHCDANTPTLVGDRVTVGHRAILHGCRVDAECIVGMGAIIQNRAHIHSHVIIASGSVVREGFDAPARTLVAGVPAMVKRALSDSEVGYIRELAAVYTGRARLYAVELGRRAD
jgi:carbonic anhydrase/acetyltransferase-like protein (isoleucine patch superfamily)